MPAAKTMLFGTIITDGTSPEKNNTWKTIPPPYRKASNAAG